MIEGSLAGLGLLVIRPGLMVTAAPILGGSFVPPVVKVGLTVLLGLLAAPALGPLVFDTPVALALAAAHEAVVGLALGLSVRVLVEGAQLAGQLAGFQIGLSYAALVDPQTGARNNVLAMLYGNVAALTFLGIDGHHALLRALAASYGAVPLGLGGLEPAPQVVAHLFGLVFALGAQLAAPVVVSLLLVEVALGLVSRAAPALNLLMFGFPTASRSCWLLWRR